MKNMEMAQRLQSIAMDLEAVQIDAIKAGMPDDITFRMSLVAVRMHDLAAEHLPKLPKVDLPPVPRCAKCRRPQHKDKGKMTCPLGHVGEDTVYD